MRFTRGDVRDHIVSHKNDHAAPYRPTELRSYDWHSRGRQHVKAIPDQVDSLGHLLTPLPALAQGGGGGGSGGGSAGGASAGGEVTPRSEPKIRRSIRRSKASAKGAEQR
jgi:hypothetical protein